MKPHTKVTSYRLDPYTLSQLEQLAAHMGKPKTEVIQLAIDRMYQQEIKTMTRHQFATLADAIAAGYRLPGKQDKDTTSPNMGAERSFGYKFESEEGEKTVTVTLTEDKNRMGQPGSYVVMFPPKPTV